MAQPRSNRPLSPHLQIWRWGPGMLVSILHRITGNGMAFIGLGLLLWWVGSVASGPEAYQSFIGWVWTPQDGNGLQAVTTILGKIVLVGLSWAFFQHMASGIRHLILDVGANYELVSNKRGSNATIVFGIVATIAFWAFVLLR